MSDPRLKKKWTRWEYPRPKTISRQEWEAIRSLCRKEIEDYERRTKAEIQTRRGC